MGHRIECSIDDKKLLEFTDETFTQPGRVGLWTKADAVTYFDNFTVEPADADEDGDRD